MLRLPSLGLSVGLYGYRQPVVNAARSRSPLGGAYWTLLVWPVASTVVAAVLSPSTDRAESSGRAASRRVPALDGLRGLALVGMLLWHAEVGWVQGGFARMTIFFALSGYLATMSWLRVRARSGGFRTFWWRRARRLLPVSFLGIAVAVAVTTTSGTAGMQRRLPGDVVSVLGYVANLRFWLSGQSYGELFGEPSLLQHYWTLAIEEQAFIVLPLLLAAVLALRRGGWLPAVIVAMLAVVLLGLPAIVSHSPDAVWYSSFVRFGEFCGGVALALWCSRDGETTGPRPTSAVATGGTVGLFVLIAVMLTIPRDAAWLYRGGMGLVVVPTVLALAAAAADVGPAARLLSWAPLTRLGRWTFSIYVLHWPLFWVVDGTRTGLAGWELASVRMGAAVAVGAVVHVLVERPLMAKGPATQPLPADPPALMRLDRALLRAVPSGWWRTRPAAGALAIAGCSLAFVSILPGRGAADDRIRFEFFDDLPEDVASEPSSGIADGAEVDGKTFETAELRMIVAEPGRIRLGIFGGSVATVLDGGGIDYRERSEQLSLTPGATRLGCGLVSEGRRVVGWDQVTWEAHVGRVDPRCGLWPGTWRAVAELAELDVALVVPGTWDTMSFDIDGLGSTHVGEAAFDEILHRHLTVMLDGFRSAGIDQVQLATTPVPGDGADGRAWRRRGFDQDHVRRITALNNLLRDFADGHDDVAVLNLAAQVNAWDEDVRDARLPDGLHYSPRGAAALWEEYLGEAIVTTYDGRSDS